MMLGYLLARAGVEVTLLEREPAFSQSSRGDAFSAASLRVFREAGLVDQILSLRHQKITRWEIYYEGRRHSTRDLARLSPDFPFLLVIPAAEVLNLIVAKAEELPEFDLRAGASVTALLEEEGEVQGVEFEDAEGTHRLRSRLVVGADGWASSVRSLGKIQPMAGARTALEMTRVRLPAPADWPEAVGRTYLGPGSSIVWYTDRDGNAEVTLTLPRTTYPGVPDIASLKEALASRLPGSLGSHLRSELSESQEVERLEIEPSRASSWWRPGLLLIGDAAHCFAPYGGVGIALALRDALVAANHLSRAFRDEGPTTGVLAAIEAERLAEVSTLERDQERATRAIFRPNDPTRFLLRYGGMRRAVGSLVGRFDSAAQPVKLEIEG
jgi:2-polyprenyl-6-methoxyphenol hydroxylase-like FAD-dependent oxidoreductase